MNQENESESLSDIAKKFKLEMEKSPQFSSYITINADGPVLNLTEFQHTTGELVNFYHFSILPSKPHKNLLFSDIVIIVSKDCLIYHQLEFISETIYDIQSCSFKKNTSDFESFLNFLDDLQRKYVKFPISVNSKKINDDFSDMPIKAQILEKFGEKLKLKAHQKELLDPNNKKLYQKLMTSLAPFLLKKSILPYHCFQDIFNAAVSQDIFIFHNEIKSFFNSFDKFDPYIFIETMTETCERFISFFQLSGLRNSNIIIFNLLQQYIFDEIYPSNHYFFKSDYTNVDIIFPIAKYTFQKINLSLDYFPPNTKPRNTIRKILREDEFYKLAIDDLEQMQFYTSPYNICACALFTIQDIKKGAEHYSKSSLDLNSDELITIFMAVAIASDIPELMSLCNFVENFVINPKSTDLIPVSNEMKHAKNVFIIASKKLLELSDKERKKFQSV